MLKKLWKQAVDNLDSALAIIISIVAAFYGVFSNQSPLLAAISGTLSLLALGMIKDRNAREELLRQLQQLKEPPSVSSIFRNRSNFVPFNDLTASAQKICLVGPTLVSLFNQWSSYIQDTKLQEHGATIQAIILDHQSLAVESAANCINKSSGTLKTEIENTKRIVKEILESKNGLKNGLLELRILSTNLNFTMVLIDPEMPHGKIIVEFIGYHAGLHEIPHIVLNRPSDKEWYEFFLRQYKHIYDDSQLCLTNEEYR